MSKRIVEIGTRQARKATKTTWDDPPPRDIVQGWLIQEWKECWSAIDAFNTQANEEVPLLLLKKCKHNEGFARNVQVQALFTIIADVQNRVWQKLGGVNPAVLTPGHRKARAIAQQWTELPEMPKTYSEKFRPLAVERLARALADTAKLNAAITEAVQSGKKVVKTRWFVPDPVENKVADENAVDESAGEAQP